MKTTKPPRSLTIAVVTETYPPEINGVALTIGRLVQGLLARGHQITLTRPRQGRADAGCPQPGLRETLVHGLPLPGYPGLQFGLPAKRRLLRQWRRQPPDVVQVVTEGPLGAAAIAAARQLGIPVISDFHTNFQQYSRHYGLGWLQGLVSRHLRRLHNRSALTLTPTRELAAQLAADGYQRLALLARGVDTERFTPLRRSEDLRAHWGAKPTTLVVACVGRLAAEKNLGLVEQVFQRIAAVHPDCRMLWVGDGPERAELQAVHPEHIFAGMRLGDDLAAHYASADLFLMPSLTETFGNVTLEAMASGLPVIAFNYAAARELIRHHGNGLVAEPGDDADFMKQVDYALKYPTVLRELGRRARADSLLQNWDRIIDQLAALLQAAADHDAERYVLPESALGPPLALQSAVNPLQS